MVQHADQRGGVLWDSVVRPTSEEVVVKKMRVAYIKYDCVIVRHVTPPLLLLLLYTTYVYTIIHLSLLPYFALYTYYVYCNLVFNHLHGAQTIPI